MGALTLTLSRWERGSADSFSRWERAGVRAVPPAHDFERGTDGGIASLSRPTAGW